MPANKISHNNGMAQLPLAISGKPFTTMKKALFHGRLRVFGEKMNTSVYRGGRFSRPVFQSIERGNHVKSGLPAIWHSQPKGTRRGASGDNGFPLVYP